MTVDLQTYPAEVGVGALCTTVSDELSFCASVVDHGKSVTVGDAVLVELSERLRAAIRVPDTLARFGGDEFVALCEDLGGAEERPSSLRRT